jgi:hypothetical protein
VGAGHLADIEAILGLPQLFGEHIDIGLARKRTTAWSRTTST